MGTHFIKRKAEEDRKPLKKSDKAFILGGLLSLTGFILAWHFFRNVASPPDTKLILEGATSPFYMKMLGAMAPFIYRISLLLFLAGLFVILMGYMNRRDEKIDETPDEP